MNILRHNAIFFGVACALAACGGGGGGGGGSAPVAGGGSPPPAAALSPGGFYLGDITGCSSVCPVAATMLVSEDGEWVGMDPVYTAGANAGKITMTGASIQSDREFYSGNPTAFGFRPGSPARDDGSGDFREFDGRVEERQRITGTFVHNAARRTKIDVTYQPTYETDSSLAAIAGMYSASDASGFSLTYTIDSSGALTGSDTEGCVASGDVKLIDTEYNMYRFELSFSSCPANGAQGNHNGVGALLDNGAGVNDTLLFSALEETGETLVILELEKL